MASSPFGPVFTSGGASALAVHRSGNFLFVTGDMADQVAVLQWDSVARTLALVGTLATGDQPVSVTTDAAGQFLYVANTGSNDISAYRIEASAMLTPIQCSTAPPAMTCPAGQLPFSLAATR